MEILKRDKRSSDNDSNKIDIEINRAVAYPEYIPIV